MDGAQCEEKSKFSTNYSLIYAMLRRWKRGEERGKGKYVRRRENEEKAGSAMCMTRTNDSVTATAPQSRFASCSNHD